MLGAALGWLAGSVLRLRRRVVEGALGRGGIAAPPRVAREMYARLGAGIFELLWLAGAGASRREKAVRDHVAIEPDLERAIISALAKGPVVFAASHTGNWEVAAHAAARLVRAHGHGLSVVVKPMALSGFDSFLKRLRSGLGITLVSPNGALRSARSALGRGDAVAMMIDQVPDHARHGTTAPFLGQPALCDRGPAVLAKRAGATFLVVAAKRVGRDHRVVLLGEHDAAATGANATELTRAATSALDAFVRAQPAEWMWLHRRWREPRTTRVLAGPAAAAAPRLVARRLPG